MTTKILVVILTVLAGLGVIAAVVFQVFSGLDYRDQEMQGLEPGYAPEWTVIGTTIGFWVFVVAALALAAIGVARLVRGASARRRKPAGS